MKVGLLGGSFNPPHQGHIYISNLASKKLGLNQVWWLPAIQNPLKEKLLKEKLLKEKLLKEKLLYENYAKRLQKCVKLTKANPKIYIKRSAEIYTFNLVSRLQNRYKNIEFFWLMGADNLEKFHYWKNFKKLTARVPLVIFSREKFLRKITKTRSWKFISLSKYKIFYTKNMDIASSQIKKFLHE
jgi:nicotinate-nucleotide adenylyltransferase